MAKNQLKSQQVGDGEIKRADLYTGPVALDAVIAKVIAGTGGISITQTGAAAGTGDVTINLTAATNIAITDNNSLNLAVYPVWVDTALGGGNYPPKISSTKISFNPSTGLLTLAGGITYGGKITAGVDTADSKLAIGSMEFHAHGLNNNWIADNLYYGSAAVRYRAAGYGSFIRFLNGAITLHNWVNGAAGAAVTTEAKYQFKADYSGGVAMGGTMTSYTPGDYTGCAMVVKLGVAIGSTTDPGAGVLKVEGSISNSTFRVGSMEFQPYGLNNVWFGDNIYFDGSNMKYRATGYAGKVRWFSGQTTLHNYPSGTAGTSPATQNVHQFKCDYNGNVALGGNMADLTVGVFTGAAMVVKLGVNVGGAATDPGTGNLRLGADVTQGGILYFGNNSSRSLQYSTGLAAYSFSNASVYAGGILLTSSRSLKKNIKDWKPNNRGRLRPRIFERLTRPGVKEVGFVAEEIELKDIVVRGPDDPSKPGPQLAIDLVALIAKHELDIQELQDLIGK